MNRRAFLASLTGGLLAAPLGGEAQQGGKLKMPRIGVLSLFSAEHPQARELSGAFRQGLLELGYVEGQNIVIESRSAQGRLDRLPEVLAELVRLKVELIFSLGGTPAARAAKQANITIPIVAPGRSCPAGC